MISCKPEKVWKLFKRIMDMIESLMLWYIYLDRNDDDRQGMYDNATRVKVNTMHIHLCVGSESDLDQLLFFSVMHYFCSIKSFFCISAHTWKIMNKIWYQINCMDLHRKTYKQKLFVWHPIIIIIIIFECQSSYCFLFQTIGDDDD